MKRHVCTTLKKCSQQSLIILLINYVRNTGITFNAGEIFPDKPEAGELYTELPFHNSDSRLN